MESISNRARIFLAELINPAIIDISITSQPIRFGALAGRNEFFPMLSSSNEKFQIDSERANRLLEMRIDIE